MINADRLYEEMKEILIYFNLRFSDKHLVKVYIENDNLIFSYRGKQLHLDVNNLK